MFENDREIAVKLNEIKFLDIGEQCGENEKHFAENSISVFVVRVEKGRMIRVVLLFFFFIRLIWYFW